jgi:hypothetical protein
MAPLCPCSKIDSSSLSLFRSDVALPAILRIARGGFSEMFAKSQEPTLDMSRVGMRLDGIQVYATLAALLTNACLELYSNIQVPKAETDNNRPRVIFYLIQNGTGERFRYRITEFWAQSASIQIVDLRHSCFLSYPSNCRLFFLYS